ncbi:MAG: C25 family cysteine peptidase [Bacteroidota bacterium]
MYTRLYFVLLIWLLYTLTPLCAQFTERGNEWYTDRANQSFIKMTLAEDGWYEVTFSDLLSEGHDLSGVDPDHLHLYYRGEELPLRIWKNGNILEKLGFWGMRNDGKVDQLMYRHPNSRQPDPSQQSNPTISLFDHTSAYFLTWDSLPGYRYQISVDTQYQNYVPETSFRYTTEVWHHPADPLRGYAQPIATPSQLIAGGGVYESDGTFFDPAYNPAADYTVGIGFHGPHFSPQHPLSLSLATPHPANTQPDIQLSVRLLTFSRNQLLTEIEANQQVLFDSLAGIKPRRFTDLVFTFSGPLSPETALDFRTTFVNGNASPIFDEIYISWMQLSYERQCILDDASGVKLQEDAHTLPIYYQFEEVNGGSRCWVVDATQGMYIEGRLNQDTAHIILPPDSLQRSLHLVTDAAIQQPFIHSAHHLHNLCSPGNGAEYVIITDERLDSSAQAYANFRAGSYSTKVVHVHEIVEEFGYGSLTPWAIKRFLNCAYQAWLIKPQYVLLWGKGLHVTSHLNDSTLSALHFVPSIGFPESNLELVTPFQTDSLAALMSIGRLGIISNEQGWDYLDKVQQFESTSSLSEMPNILIYGKGFDSFAENNSPATAANFQANLIKLFPTVDTQQLYTYFDSDAFLSFPCTSCPPFVSLDSLAADSMIDAGTNLIYFQGIIDSPRLEEIFPPAAYYENGNRLPLIYANGFTDTWTNSWYEPNQFSQTTATEWVIEPDQGAVAFLGFSGIHYYQPSLSLAREFFRSLEEEMLGQPLGDMARAAQVQYANRAGALFDAKTALILNLEGDPSLVPFRMPVVNRTLYPGDTDKDGVANVADLLPIGLAYGDTGTTRNGATLDWIVQEAPDWSAQFPDGRSHSYADVDGNGIVEGIDTLGIRLNYSRTSDKTQSSNFTQNGLPLTIVYPTAAQAGDTINVGVFLGDSIQSAPVYGLAFFIQLDPALVDSNSLSIDFGPNWLGTVGVDILTMYHYDGATGRLDVAITRIDQQAVWGYGQLMDISIMITDDIAKRFQGIFVADPVWGKVIDHSGEAIPVSATSQKEESATNPSPPLSEWAVYPNPGQGKLTLETHQDWRQVRLYDLQGKVVMEVRDLTAGTYNWDLSHLPEGLYVLRAMSLDSNALTKILLTKRK